MKILLAGILCPFLSIAQTNPSIFDNGISIKWDQSANWNIVINKAKLVHKYIFVDCFTTWCIPCKKMDKEVYTNDSVAQFINEHFIPVRLQMDKTKKDDELTKSWYNDASIIHTTYIVSNYPTYLFFSSDGKLVHRDGSYNEPSAFLAIAKQAIDPKKQYSTLLDVYKRGSANYEMMPFLIKQTWFRYNNKSLADSMATLYFDYLKTQPKENLFKEDILEFFQYFIPNTRSPFFGLFYPNSKKANKVMKSSFFSRSLVDRVITRETIDPVFQNISDNTDPNWDSLYKVIDKRFGKSYADRTVYKSQIKWYDWYDAGKHQDIHKALVNVMKWVKCGGNDTTSIDDDGNLCVYAQFIADSISNKVWIDSAINWMRGVVRRNLVDKKYDDKPYHAAEDIQTLMQLLYKAGYVNEAKKWLDQIQIIIKDLQRERETRKDIPLRFYKLEDIDRIYHWYFEKFKEGVTTWRTDFSGDWVLQESSSSNNSQSQFSKTMLVIQQNDSVSIRDNQGMPIYKSLNQKIKLVDYGRISGHSGPTILSISGQGVNPIETIQETWSLSRDLKVLHIERKFFSGQDLVSEIHADYTKK